MLDIGSGRVRLCSGITRRSFLKVGSASMAGLTLPGLFGLQKAGAIDPAKEKIKNCITLFLVGSPSHHDTWDMKPNAPDNIRGPFRPTQTNVTGVQICEHFPLMARLMDKVSLIRSLHYNTGASHENGQRWMMTGHDFSENNPQPHTGSVISRVFGSRGDLPASIILPGKIANTGTSTPHGQAAGYLGSAHEPFFLNGDPARSDFQVADLLPPKGLSDVRLESRRQLLTELDALQRRADSRSVLEHDTAYSRAFSLLTSPGTKKAFDLTQEPEKLRDRYGRNTFGQSCLMARRLIEHGARYVTVNHFDTVFNLSCWDMHADGGGLDNTYDDFKNLLCPQFDWAFSALIEDLSQRGLLQETVVAVLSEFGRTPNINPRGGRDHYPNAWTNFLCGGNIKGGQVVGSTDKNGAAPQDYPIQPPQVLATLYAGMGIDLDSTTMPGPGGRPIRFIEAHPIPELIG